MKERLRTWTRRLVFPGALRASAEPAPPLLADEKIVDIISSDGQRIALIERTPATGRRWVIFLYGNAMTSAATLPVRDIFSNAGYGIIVPDYIGYGYSTGVPSESACYQTADATLDHLRDTWGIRTHDVIIAGWSLGAAVAIESCRRRPAARLVLLSPFTSLRAVALDIIKLGRLPLPGPDAFTVLRYTSAVHVPTLIVTGEDDQLTRPWMAEALVRHLSDARLIRLRAVGHDDLLTAGDRLWCPVFEFLEDSRVPDPGGGTPW